MIDNPTRPDTGTQRNMVMEMAASIMYNKADYCQCVADQLAEKGNAVSAAKWSKDAQDIRVAVALIDSRMGSWS